MYLDIAIGLLLERPKPAAFLVGEGSRPIRRELRPAYSRKPDAQSFLLTHSSPHSGTKHGGRPGTRRMPGGQSACSLEATDGHVEKQKR